MRTGSESTFIPVRTCSASISTQSTAVSTQTCQYLTQTSSSGLDLTQISLVPQAVGGSDAASLKRKSAIEAEKR